MNSGIYKITNLVNNKFYIGSAINLKIRKCRHFNELKNNTHPNKHLQNTYNKNNKLVFEVIEICEKDKLLEREQFYINTLNPEYNICRIAYSSLGVKRTDETKNKIMKSHLGKKLSEHHKENIKLGMMKKRNALGYKHTNETKEKLRKSSKNRIFDKSIILKRQKAIIQFSKNGEYINEFESIILASKILKINASDICQCCRYEDKLSNHNKSAGGYRFMYKKY